MRGARAVSQSALSDFPHANVRVAFVWIDMVAGDSATSAESIAVSIPDPRAKHMHDGKRIAGKLIADSLGGPGKTAWDVYLLYPPASQWPDRMPQPLDWAHQLGQTAFADASHYRSGAALDAKLHEWMEKLVD